MRQRMQAGRMSIALAIGLSCAAFSVSQAQSGGTRWDESWVGSEWEIYARALATRTALGDQPWSIRPFAPETIERWARDATFQHPWKSRLGVEHDSSHIRILRPSISSSYNSAFAWGMYDGAVWQGRGANVWGTAGAEFRFGPFSMRLEPTFAYAQNAAFALLPTIGGSTFGSSLEAYAIDAPQRFGAKSYALVDPGQSYARVDIGAFATGVSTENIFWGPGIRNALLFDANAAGFPHVFVGTARALHTPVGRFSAQLLYGRLEESAWAAPSVSRSRLGAGAIAVWMPPTAPIEIGAARFYHRQWPPGSLLTVLRAPFGSFTQDIQTFDNGPADNQLASLFATVRVPRAGLELFGEFGRNDRPGSTRDLIVEPEHNSAWLVGFMQSMRWTRSSFWTLRAEAASGRVSAIQDLGRGQTTFYDHTPITQGHTVRGQLLGTPLIEESGGLDAALDRWDAHGRIGLNLTERQLPGDLGVGMPSSARARSQWDLGASGTRFIRGTDVSLAFGHVWDIHRMPGVTVGNGYIRVSVRPDVSR